MKKAGQIHPISTDDELSQLSVKCLMKRLSRTSMRSPKKRASLLAVNIDNFDEKDLISTSKLFALLGWAPSIESPCHTSLLTHFPGALPGIVVHSRIMKLLEFSKLNITPANTIFGVSVCPDEINNGQGTLVDIMKEHWGGHTFHLGGLSGAPFVGKTGFGAFSHHVPDNGNVCILYAPHVAISETGEVGKHHRVGQHTHSTACGAVIGAYKKCLECNQPQDEPQDPNTPWSGTDFQFEWIKHQLMPHALRISEHANPTVALAYQAFKMVENSINEIVNLDFSSGYLVLIGGIQINLPAPHSDHFLPLSFEIRRKNEPTQYLIEEFHLNSSQACQDFLQRSGSVVE